MLEGAVEQATQAVRRVEVLIVAGTSAQVCSGNSARVIEINPEASGTNPAKSVFVPSVAPLDRPAFSTRFGGRHPYIASGAKSISPGHATAP
jgi:hypothetical protein